VIDAALRAVASLRIAHWAARWGLSAVVPDRSGARSGAWLQRGSRLGASGTLRQRRARCGRGRMRGAPPGRLGRVEANRLMAALAAQDHDLAGQLLLNQVVAHAKASAARPARNRIRQTASSSEFRAVSPEACGLASGPSVSRGLSAASSACSRHDRR
jgi:hypothetical protein